MKDLEDVRQQPNGSARMGDRTSLSAADEFAVVRVQRIENGFVAITILVTVVIMGVPWWVPFAAFLLFDLSAVGYLRNPQIGALVYNLVHNYSAPAILFLFYAVFRANDVSADWLLLVSVSWAFHVAVDRTLGYGLKVRDFQHTHLGIIGKLKGGNR
jgi:hypothetical protein